MSHALIICRQRALLLATAGDERRCLSIYGTIATQGKQGRRRMTTLAAALSALGLFRGMLLCLETGLQIGPEIVGAFGMNAIAPNSETESQLVEMTFRRVEEAWRIVDPTLKADTPVFVYEPHTWGPKEVERFTPPGGWQNPAMTPLGVLTPVGV
jgi:hypothetical protein